MKIQQTVINGRLYEDTNNFIGPVKATLPDLSYLMQTLKGIGIPGNMEFSIPGQIDSMTLTLDFQTFCQEQIALSAPRRHHLTLMVSQQFEDNSTGDVGYSAIKHVFIASPKTTKPGGVEPATPSAGSTEMAVRYWAIYIDGKRVQEIDQINNIFFINGKDYMADVRKALGM